MGLLTEDKVREVGGRRFLTGDPAFREVFTEGVDLWHLGGRVTLRAWDTSPGNQGLRVHLTPEQARELADALREFATMAAG